MRSLLGLAFFLSFFSFFPLSFNLYSGCDKIVADTLYRHQVNFGTKAKNETLLYYDVPQAVLDLSLAYQNKDQSFIENFWKKKAGYNIYVLEEFFKLLNFYLNDEHKQVAVDAAHFFAENFELLFKTASASPRNFLINAGTDKETVLFRDSHKQEIFKNYLKLTRILEKFGTDTDFVLTSFDQVHLRSFISGLYKKKGPKYVIKNALLSISTWKDMAQYDHYKNIIFSEAKSVGLDIFDFETYWNHFAKKIDLQIPKPNRGTPIELDDNE